MALQKAVAQESGVDAAYHRIVVGTVDFVRGFTRVTLASYVDADARQNGCAPLAQKGLAFGSLPPFDGDPRIWAYAQLKTLPQWANASDV